MASAARAPTEARFVSESRKPQQSPESAQCSRSPPCLCYGVVRPSEITVTSPTSPVAEPADPRSFFGRDIGFRETCLPRRRKSRALTRRQCPAVSFFFPVAPHYFFCPPLPFEMYVWRCSRGTHGNVFIGGASRGLHGGFLKSKTTTSRVFFGCRVAFQRSDYLFPIQ